MQNIARNAAKKIGESMAADSIERKNSRIKSLVNGTSTENGVKTAGKNEESSRPESADPIQVYYTYMFRLVSNRTIFRE